MNISKNLVRNIFGLSFVNLIYWLNSVKITQKWPLCNTIWHYSTLFGFLKGIQFFVKKIWKLWNDKIWPSNKGPIYWPWWLSGLALQSNVRSKLKGPEFNPRQGENEDRFSARRFTSILIDCVETVTLRHVLDRAWHVAINNHDQIPRDGS